MSEAPCNWTATPCKDCCTDALDGLGEDVRNVLAAQAAWILWDATGQQYGLCEVTLRPCRRECGSFWGGLPFPVRVAGEWINVSCGSCVSACGCSILSEFVADDVASIVEIKVDGETLDLDTAVVYDYRRVVRVDGGSWPTCQDLGATDDEPGTWAVTIMQGKPVPPGGEAMAGILLCELAKACVSDESCRLPRRAQVVTRQGVTVGFQDMFENIDQIRTGLYEVDLWIEAARTTIGQRGTITSPDVPRAPVLTWRHEESV